MTTYNSYEAAKIANPDKEILTDCKKVKFTAELGLNYYHKCNPADHCMTVEKFLADGYKFVGGDIIIDSHRSTKMIDEGAIIAMNMPAYCDKSTYILRAAALEEKGAGNSKFSEYKGITGNYQMNCLLNDAQSGVRGMIEHIKSGGCYEKYLYKLVKYDELLDFAIENTECSPQNNQEGNPRRTKVEYVKSDIESRGRALDAFDGEVELFELVDGEYKQVTTESDAISKWRNLYERIETPTTEREAFVEALQDIWFVDGFDSAKQFDKIVDSGLFKLVN